MASTQELMDFLCKNQPIDLGSDERFYEENLNKEELQPFIIFSAMCGAYCTVHADPTFKVIDALGACTAVLFCLMEKRCLSAVFNTLMNLLLS